MTPFRESVKGTYAAVKFTEDTLDRIEKLQEFYDLPNAVPRDKLHSTILYSRVYVPFIPEEGEKFLGSLCHLKVFETQFGTNALVLAFESDYMQFRHDIGTALGATWDYPEYVPHITLSYDVGARKFGTDLEFDLEIVRSHEYVEDLDLEWTTKL